MFSYCASSPTSAAPVGAEAGKDIIDVFDDMDATYAERVRRGVVRLGAVSRRSRTFVTA